MVITVGFFRPIITTRKCRFQPAPQHHKSVQLESHLIKIGRVLYFDPRTRLYQPNPRSERCTRTTKRILCRLGREERSLLLISLKMFIFSIEIILYDVLCRCSSTIFFYWRKSYKYGRRYFIRYLRGRIHRFRGRDGQYITS